MPRFIRKQAHDLDRLSDDALIAYLRAAIDAGDADGGATALAILVYGHWENVKRRVGMKVPPADVEDVASEVISSAIGAAFEGVSVGEFHNWLSTILARRIADYHRSREGKPALVSLYGGEDGEAWDLPGASEEGGVEMRDVVDQVRSTLNEDHRRVVDLNVLDGHSARYVTEQVPGMSESNVHKIASRFRDALRAECQAGDTEAP